MAIDLYATRSMMKQIETTFPPQSWLLDNFFTETDISQSEHVDVDVLTGKRKMAPFVHPSSAGVVDRRTGYSTKTMKPAYVKPYRISEAADYLKRFPGENIYASKSRDQKVAELMAKDLFELNEQITRREEWMAAQQLTTGQIPIVGEGVSVTIDLGLQSTHNLVNTDLVDNGWATASSCAPLTDLDAWQLVISQDSGFVARDVIMGATAYTKFIASDQVQEEWLPAGGQFTGTALVRGDETTGAIWRGQARGKNIWTYNELYLDDDGSTVGKMIPDKRVVMVARGARAVKHYGAIMDMDAPGGAAVRVFPKSWRESNPSVQYVMLQSAPLPFFHQIDAFLTALVVA